MIRRCSSSGVALAVAVVCAGLSANVGHAQQAAAAVYVRDDTDQTLVISPRVRVQAPISDATRVDMVYSADVWTSASIDIRASASKQITERRDEIRANLRHEFTDVTVFGGYRYSFEPDYESHSFSGGASFDFADKNSTVAVSGGASFDEVGRAGDPGFNRPVTTLNGSLSYTQVLDANMFVQFAYEAIYADGYLSSPYRYVGVGSPDGSCQGMAGLMALEFCLPEHNPEERFRNAFVAQGRRALGETMSTGLMYRFYLDDWEIMSHTASLDLQWFVGADTALSLYYRFYLQSAAAHYRPTFPTIDRLREYYTRDKELSAFQSHRVALEAEHNWPFDAPGEKFQAVLSVGPTYYLYDNFPPFKSITALEVTLSGVLLL